MGRGDRVVDRTHAMRYARNMVRLSLWTAVGVALGGLEQFIPQPLPWVKLGVANLASLLVLYGFGWRSALLVNVARVLIVAMFLGTWATPVFILSLGGAIISVPAMAMVRVLGRNHVSMISVSAAGAFVHMLTQFALASLLIARHGGIFMFAGPSLILAIVSGVLIGVLGALLRKHLPVKITHDL